MKEEDINIVIYTPPYGYEKKTPKKAKLRRTRFYEFWTFIEDGEVSEEIHCVRKSALEIKFEGSVPVFKGHRIKKDSFFCLAVWAGLSKDGYDDARIRLNQFFAKIEMHKRKYLQGHSSFLLGKERWELRYLNGENLSNLFLDGILKEVPKEIKKLSWKDLAEKVEALAGRKSISEEALKQSIKKFKKLLPQYAPWAVELVDQIEEKAIQAKQQRRKRK